MRILPAMLAAVLSGSAAAESPIPLSSAAPIAIPGEQLTGAVVTELTDHREFHAISLRLDDGRELRVEVVQTTTPRGACTHHGFAVQPRWELLGEQNQQVEDQPAFIQELCARVKQSPPALELAPVRGDQAPGAHSASGDAAAHAQDLQQAIFTATGAPVTVHPLQLVLLATLLAGFLAAVRSRLQRRPRPVTAPGPTPSPAPTSTEPSAEPSAEAPRARATTRTQLVLLAAITALGAVLRWTLGLWAPLWSPWFGFGRLADVLGAADRVSRYGDGYSAMMTAMTRLFGPSSDTIFTTNAVVGTLSVPLAWAVVRALAPQRPPAALATALFVASLPVHVWQSATEVMHVWLVAFELLAMWAAAEFIRTGPTERLAGLGFALTSAGATVLALHTRPEAIAFAIVPAACVLLFARRSHRPAVVLAAMTIAAGLAFRLAEMAFDVSDEASALDYSLLTEPMQWVRVFLPDLSSMPHHQFTSVWMRPTLTSPVIPLLAIVGLFCGPWRRTVVLGLWWAATLIPVLPKGWPLADAYRLQTPSLMAVAVLAGFGAARGLQWWSRQPVAHTLPQPALWAILTVTLAPQLFWERPQWGTLEEARLLLETAPSIHNTATVLYDHASPHSTAFARWGAQANPGTRWVPMQTSWDTEPPTQPFMAWISSSCFDTGDRATEEADPSAPCTELRARCSLRPAHTRAVSLTGDIGFDFRAKGPVELGFYYLDECAGSASPGEKNADSK